MIISTYKEIKNLGQNQKMNRLGKYLELMTDKRLFKELLHISMKNNYPKEKCTEGSFQTVNTQRTDSTVHC